MEREPSTEMDAHGLAYHIMVAVLRIALLSALVISGWSIYRHLSDNDAPKSQGSSNNQETELFIVLRQVPGADMAAQDIPVELFPIDVTLAQHEFLEDPHPGVRFNDYLMRRMKGRPSIKVRLDAMGQATLAVPEGRWWIEALLVGTDNIEWRLPINVAGRHQEVELTPENAYARTRSF